MILFDRRCRSNKLTENGPSDHRCTRKNSHLGAHTTVITTSDHHRGGLFHEVKKWWTCIECGLSTENYNRICVDCSRSSSNG